VILTILMESGREKELKTLQDSLRMLDRTNGMQRFPISVHQATRQYVSLTIIYGYDETFVREKVEIAIMEALGVSGNGVNGSHGLFGIRNRDFGKSEHLTMIEGVVQTVDGVRWVNIVKASTLPTKVSSSNNVIGCGHENILALRSSDLYLTDVMVTESESAV